MPSQRARATRSAEGLSASSELSAEERQRRSYLVLCFAIMIPAIAAFAVADLVQGRPGEGLATFGLVAALMMTFGLILRWRRIWSLFRFALLVPVAMLVYVMASGGGDDYVFLWFFTFPLIVFFLFGKTEGSGWVLATLVILLALFFGNVGSHPYDPIVGLRFTIAYVLVAALAYGLEASRRRYYEELLGEKTSLERALAQVKTLRGLLPICSSCKSVRDDRGYWKQIEAYVGQHSEAEFSRGLCPQCSAELGGEPANDSPQDEEAPPGD